MMRAVGILGRGTGSRLRGRTGQRGRTVGRTAARLVLAGLAAATLAGCLSRRNEPDRDGIRVVGPAAVYPFTSAVAEQWGRANAGFRAPAVASTRAGAEIDLFCAGIGGRFPDIAETAARITPGALAGCAARHVGAITEIATGATGQPARPAFLYVKQARLDLVPGLRQFVATLAAVARS